MTEYIITTGQDAGLFFVQKIMHNAHTKPSEIIVKELNTDEHKGLDAAQVTRSRETSGQNILPEGKKVRWYHRFAKQFLDIFVGILVLAGIIAYLAGDLKDAIIIAIIILLNATFGFLQEQKAEQAIAALQALSQDSATVLRGGETQRIAVSDVVVGDILLLESGDTIAADARVLQATQLRVIESALTGESQAVSKQADVIIALDAPLGDRLNMLYKDTSIAEGRATAVVVAVGKDTEVGKISTLLQQTVEKKTPLEQELHRIGTWLTGFAILSAGIIFLSLGVRGDGGFQAAALTAISLAVAVVPEGIPAVVTTVLAISVARLAKNNAIIRKLSAVETLGAVSAILTDKTGTLTKNEMTVLGLMTPDNEYDFAAGVVTTKAGEAFMPAKDTAADPLNQLFLAMVLCNNASLQEDGQHIGDPTETCLLVAAQEYGMSLVDLNARHPRTAELPFNSETKRMIVAVMDEDAGDMVCFVKGAHESVVALCADATPEQQAAVEAQTALGKRVLSYAMARIPKEAHTTTEVETLLTDVEYSYLGATVAIDPLRDEVITAVQEASRAGIRSIMITGDHRLIATTIGKQLGIITNEEQVRDGSQLVDASQDDLKELLETVSVFSRVSPEQKLLIVKAMQERGNIVAVTGDGVNDAPAIKTANIGVAMGVTGTDVTKQVADMVLKDDNYATIVEAVRQGRGIFQNFISFLRYQISCNVSGVITVFAIVMAGFPAPLLPIHILLLNLASETGPSIALGLEKAPNDTMKNPPRNANEPLLSRKRLIGIAWEAAVMGAVAITAYLLTESRGYGIATTATLTTAFLSRLWHAWSSRVHEESVFSRSLFSNKTLLWVVLVTLVSYAAIFAIPAVRSVLKMTLLPMDVLVLAVGLSFVSIVCIEVGKVALRPLLRRIA
jgi:Ca2+-transporting ATPase